MIYQEFFLENEFVKIKADLNGKKYFIFTDILDVAELKTRINDNLETLSKISGDIVISQNESKVYSVSSNFDVIKLKNVVTSAPSLHASSHNYANINLKLEPLSTPEKNKNIGIPIEHQKTFSLVADRENIIIGFRPVDEKSSSLMQSGHYSSKGLAIKGKSADWGPHSGFIPVEQRFAKSSGRAESKKYNSYVQDSLAEGKGVSVILEITSERINELQQYKTISSPTTINKNGDIQVTSVLDGSEFHFILKKLTRDGVDTWQVYYQDNGEIKPLYVVGDPKTGKAMTADYDLFSIIFPISELEHYVKVSEMPTWAEWKASVNYDELTPRQKALYTNEAEYNKYEGRDNGITNNRIKEIKNKLNKELGRTDGMELIHHGADDANPASVMKENFPITFFPPKKLKIRNALTGFFEAISIYFPMNAFGAIIIYNVKELSNFQQLLINQGYRVPLNKKWSIGDLKQYFDPQKKYQAALLKGVLSWRGKKA
ncbi:MULTISPECIES: anthrax toxin-like adenylyl cyclase domain-containing protein [unclassified Providencia]|uniref:anthrax toxin-like adenylyl cyclase domain-containing protein n=1 Tax=unclassified Providencia TaxID=2633465 RepID=UPI0012B53EF9|nr:MULTISPECIES: anthrax toxin-like adenylyl cyclase domain-containing protein [unclassified Providencia]MTC24865.1 hypothetical protein [Providencia sp. wls1938]